MDSEELRDLQEEQAQLKQLIDSEGWKWFVEAAQVNFNDAFEHRIAIRPMGQDDMIAKIYDLGEVAGIRRLVNLPALRLEVVAAEIKQMTEKMENNDGSN